MSLESPSNELPSDLVGSLPDGLTEDPFDRLTRMASRLLSAPVALIAFAEAGHFKLRSQLGLGLGGRDLPASLCAATAESGEPLLLSDAKADPRFSRDPAVTGPPHLRAFAGVPLLGPDGMTAGVFCVLDRSPRPFTGEQVKTLKYLAAIAEDELAKIARVSGNTAPVTLPPPPGGGTDESADVGELRQLFSSHDTAVFLHAAIDQGMRSLITGVNEAGCDLLGYTRNSLLQHSFVDLFYQSQPEWLEEIDRMLDGQCDVVFKIALRSALGAPVPVEINTRLLGAGSPVPAYTIVTRLADERSDSLGEEGPPIAELASGLLCRFTPDGTLTFVNDAYCDYAGEDRENLEGFIFRPLTIEEDRGISESAIAAITPDHAVAACEYRVYGRDGRPGWQRWVYTGMFDAGGSVLEYQAVGNGFRKDAPEPPEAIAPVASDETQVPAEPPGPPPAERETSPFEIPPAMDLTPANEPPAHPVGAHESVAADVENFVEASPAPLPGTPALDETWDMQATPSSAQSAPAPRTAVVAAVENSAAADERFRLLMQASNDGIWDWHLQARHGYFSPRWKDMLGFSEAELQDHPRTFFRLLHPEDRPAVWAALRTHLQRRDPFTFTARFRHKDGSHRWIFCRGDTQRDADGSPVRMLGIHTDVTNLKRTEEALRSAKEAAETAERSKNEFLAVMSHEIRTPMNGIIGFTDLLLATELQDEQRDYLNTIKSSSDSLMSLLSDILDLARIEAGGLELENRPFALGEFMEETVAAHRAKAEEKALHINLRLDANTPDTIVTDPTKLRQILNNLINNAIKFTAQGHVDLTVLAIGREGPATNDAADLPLYSLEFRVSDTGIGIQSERLDRLFRPFSQADTSTTRRFGGMGLGLVIAQRLCALMGGSIKARSEVGKGSVFTFNLALPGEKRGDSAEDFSGDTHGDSENGSRLLVAEDNPVNQKLIRAMLKRLGLVADYALNGLEVLEMNSRRQPYEIIFMDVHMPAMDGLMATRRIRELERENPDRPKSYIIALTADAMPGDRELCLEAGVDDYLTKPFKQSDLSQAMERAQEIARPA